MVLYGSVRGTDYLSRVKVWCIAEMGCCCCDGAGLQQAKQARQTEVRSVERAYILGMLWKVEFRLVTLLGRSRLSMVANLPCI